MANLVGFFNNKQNLLMKTQLQSYNKSVENSLRHIHQAQISREALRANFNNNNKAIGTVTSDFVKNTHARKKVALLR